MSNKDLESLLNAGNDSLVKTATQQELKPWDGRINMSGLDKIDPSIRQFIEAQGFTLAGYAKRALMAQLKKDGFASK